MEVRPDELMELSVRMDMQDTPNPFLNTSDVILIRRIRTLLNRTVFKYVEIHQLPFLRISSLVRNAALVLALHYDYCTRQNGNVS